MLTILRDYFSLNRRRYKRAFCVIYFLFFLGQMTILLQTHSAYRVQSFVMLGIVSAIMLAALVALFVVLVGSLDAYLRGAKLARDAGVELSKYVASDDYRQRGKLALRRTDPEPKW